MALMISRRGCAGAPTGTRRRQQRFAIRPLGIAQVGGIEEAEHDHLLACRLAWNLSPSYPLFSPPLNGPDSPVSARAESRRLRGRASWAPAAAQAGAVAGRASTTGARRAEPARSRYPATAVA